MDSRRATFDPWLPHIPFLSVAHDRRTIYDEHTAHTSSLRWKAIETKPSNVFRSHKDIEITVILPARANSVKSPSISFPHRKHRNYSNLSFSWNQSLRMDRLMASNRLRARMLLVLKLTRLHQAQSIGTRIIHHLQVPPRPTEQQAGVVERRETTHRSRQLS